MYMIKDVISDIRREQALIRQMCDDAEELIASYDLERPGFDLGLAESFADGSHTIKRGDIVFHTKDHTVSIATGEHDEIGRPISIHKKGKKALEVQFLKVGPHAKSQEVRHAASKMATKYPDRRVLIYGEHDE